jgi:hypothetical protein
VDLFPRLYINLFWDQINKIKKINPLNLRKLSRDKNLTDINVNTDMNLKKST